MLFRVLMALALLSLSSRARLAMQSRVRSSLESMDHYIRHVTVTLEDVNGPKGGEDMTEIDI